MLNLKTLAAAATATLHLKGADDELLFADDARTLPLELDLYGPGSPAAAAVEAERNSRNLALMKKNGGKLELSPEEQRRQKLNRLVAHVAAARNINYDDLAGMDAVRPLLADTELGFIAQQVDTFIVDWANFPNGSAKS